MSCFLDPINKNYIIGNGGIQKIERSLCIGDDHITITCITTLMYLYAPEIKTGNYKLIFQVKYLILININHVVCGLLYFILNSYCKNWQINKCFCFKF